MVFRVFIVVILVRTSVKKGHLDENGFRHCYGNFFRKLHSEYYFIKVMFKVPSQQLRGTSTILNDTLQLFILGTWINMHAKSFIKTSVDVTETRIDEVAWKKIVKQSVHLEEHCTKTEITFYLFYALLLLTNLVFKFDIV